MDNGAYPSTEAMMDGTASRRISRKRTAAYAFDEVAHSIPPVALIRLFWNEYKVGTGSNARHQGEPSAVTTHDLDDEGAGVGRGGGFDIVNHLADAVNGRVAADGDVGTGHVVVDGADETDDVEVLVGGDLLLGKLAGGDKFLEQGGPFGAEHVGTGEGSVTTTDDQGVDAVEDHVFGGDHTSGALEEGGTTLGANEGTTQREPISDILPVKPLDHVTALDQTLISVVDTVRVAIEMDGRTDDGSNDGVHARGVTSRGHDGNLLLRRGGGPGGRVDYRWHCNRSRLDVDRPSEMPLQWERRQGSSGDGKHQDSFVILLCSPLRK